MTASDARALAQHLVQRGDDALASLLAARHIAPTVGWNDAFDAAEALLDPASLDRALVALTGDEVDALSGDGPVPPGPVRDTLHERALIDADGTPYTAVRTALETIRRRGVATASGAVAPPAAEGSDDAGAAERAFASLGSLADILHAALAHPFGRIGAARYLGLPGNPVSAFVIWHVIGMRIAQALAGIVETDPPRILVRAGFERPRRSGRCEFLPARLGSHDGHGTRTVEIATSEVSHRVALLAQADGLLLIPSETDRIQRGDMLEFLPFSDG